MPFSTDFTLNSSFQFQCAQAGSTRTTNTMTARQWSRVSKFVSTNNTFKRFTVFHCPKQYESEQAAAHLKNTIKYEHVASEGNEREVQIIQK